MQFLSSCVWDNVLKIQIIGQSYKYNNFHGGFCKRKVTKKRLMAKDTPHPPPKATRVKLLNKLTKKFGDI